MKLQDLYQCALVVSATLAILGIGVFIFRELFPEYKAYQHAYVDLEKFRSNDTLQPLAPFSKEIKQIVIQQPHGGPETIDRCISCHVTTELPHFSPSRIAIDVNGRPILNGDGVPVLENNPDYIWGRLDEKIEELVHPSMIETLHSLGRKREAEKRISTAKKLSQMKKIRINGKEIDAEKVLRMHPLIGCETRPFEYHPIEKYGCTSCHGGNGKALTAERAHGPVFDGEFKPAFRGPMPSFTEIDIQNDPLFARMYNHKPDHYLTFQTTPLLAGPLVEAQCVQCHQPASSEAVALRDKLTHLVNKKQHQIEFIKQGALNDKAALAAFVNLYSLIKAHGREDAIVLLQEQLISGGLTTVAREEVKGKISYLKDHEEIDISIVNDITKILGSEEAALTLLNTGVNEDKNETLISKINVFHAKEKVLKKMEGIQQPVVMALQDKTLLNNLKSHVDILIADYCRGKELFISQACYACHRIAGYSRGSVGPELTQAGLSYPWYIKESIVWPQADLPSSTMPNFRLDHEELACLMTFLMAQKGESKAIAQIDYQIKISNWEKGEKMPWELPLSAPTDNIQEGQKIFACEGCASCHKLKGFNSQITLAEEVDQQGAYQQNKKETKEWFHRTFPEHMPGSALAKAIESQADEIDLKIVIGTQNDAILEEIEVMHPGLLESFYTNFKYAHRAFDTAYKNQPDQLSAYKKRVHKVLMVYISEYGLGRDIAPPLHWSGVWRDDEWLLGHFHNPQTYTAKSLMPVMPFDDTKFFLLNRMLHEMGKTNRDKLHATWRAEGFDPPLAYEMLCSSCHGQQRQGNGMVAEWIFPIPKNLKNPIFLHNLTKERAIHSITHGVKGTPMPPWGEAISEKELGDERPLLSSFEIRQLVDWLYQELPAQAKESNQKWAYKPLDIVKEMKKEGTYLNPAPEVPADLEKCVGEYFEIKQEGLNEGQDRFYIKEKFYTEENLADAQEYFMMNCAICHGNEGSGTGVRATSMVEAKPRVFTDIPWIRSKDDLFILRSIKYGVPGTSMVSWGDQTSAVQRMQLAMFIRNLSTSAIYRQELQTTLYHAFDCALRTIEESRNHFLASIGIQEEKLNSTQQLLFELLETSTQAADEAGKLYAQMFKDEIDLKMLKKMDGIYQRLANLLRQEKGIYSSLGEQLIAVGLYEGSLKNYLMLVKKQPLIYGLENNRLTQQEGIAPTEELAHLIKLLGENPSLDSLKAKFITQLADAAALRNEQIKLFQLL